MPPSVFPSTEKSQEPSSAQQPQVLADNPEGPTRPLRQYLTSPALALWLAGYLAGRAFQQVGHLFAEGESQKQTGNSHVFFKSVSGLYQHADLSPGCSAAIRTALWVLVYLRKLANKVSISSLCCERNMKMLSSEAKHFCNDACPDFTQLYNSRPVIKQRLSLCQHEAQARKDFHSYSFSRDEMVQTALPCRT